MGKIQNDKHKSFLNVTHSGIMAGSALLLISLTVSSCQVIAGIFKAGMGFGIFIILAVLVVIGYFTIRLRKKP